MAGKVVEVSTNGRLAVLDPDGTLQILENTTRTQAWRKGAWSTESPRVGDCVYARGVRGGDDNLMVDRVWANIETIRGTVAETSGDGLQLALEDGTVAEVESQGLTSALLSRAEPDDDAYVVAFFDPETLASTASNVVLSAPVANSSQEPSLENSADALATSTFFGLTTWFCCGNVSGCGKCGSSGQGYCRTYGPTCRSDRLHMAWPKVEGSCPPTCGNCCPSAAFPCVICDRSITVANPCTGRSTGVRVRDRGPKVRCVARTGCMNYEQIRFDLTPCAFSAIGNLEKGVINCHATL